ncbi:LacI family DNA-binding transcriptional regulator [Bifidobacterium choloepi]|uniref:LacI family transcriptional regulator n=1 Tax=Bifidobacterium choloepi TaxID=2614131 RepID=A0A6I5MYX8_9BIFI|nr:LacI family DNA-binding transcriptional regulator [Bifidobacterium choloepi]NEG69487.1 LacI family transcriptional regulator [Bifidobacterium choloepi]
MDDEDTHGTLDETTTESSGHKVTIRDVARAAGVSPSTVSRAFAKPDRVSAATTRRIFEAAAKLGYHSEEVENVPLRGTKGMIGVIVPDVANQFFSDLIRSIHGVVSREGFCLSIYESRESPLVERETFDRMAAHVDGVILGSSRMPDSMVRKCAQTRPLVLTNRQVLGVNSVVFDVTNGVRQLTDYIRKAGFTTMTYLDGPASSWSVGTRWNAIRKACAERNIIIRRVWPNAPTFEGGKVAASHYLEHPTTMVVAHNDLMALGFLSAMRHLGFEAPRDFSIAGFDNGALAEISQPQLTTVKQPSQIIGAKAAQMLLERIHGDRHGTEYLTLPTSLITRDSTRALPDES